MSDDEMDWVELPYLAVGTASAEVVTGEDDHASHSFLYMPDLTSQTGWSAHNVPERQERRQERRPMGFARPRR